MRELEETIARRCDSIRDTVEYIANKVVATEHKVVRVLRLLEPGLPRLAWAVVFQTHTGDIIMSGTQNKYTLTNAANPAAATRWLGGVDLAGGTVLPTVAVTSGNAALVQIVSATALTDNGEFVFGVYPVGTGTETNDQVVVAATLPDGTPAITLNFTISGTPATPETETLDPSSAVGSWAGAPSVPSTPI